MWITNVLILGLLLKDAPQDYTRDQKLTIFSKCNFPTLDLTQKFDYLQNEDGVGEQYSSTKQK